MAGQWRGGGSGRGEWSGISVFGVVLIVVGGIFLVNELGIFHLGWRMLWPVLLIAIGAVVLLNALARQGARHQGPGAASTSIAREGAGRLELEVAVGAGTFSLGAGSGQLLDVRSTVSDIAAQQRRDGDLVQVRLRQDLASFGGWRANTNWEIHLAPDIPTRLKFDAGAGSFDVDLELLAIVEAKLQVGAARTRIVLPRPRGEVVVSITGGAASFAIEVPAGVEYRFESSGGLTSIDGSTQSPGYGTASDHVLVRFSGGASSVRIG